jgi:hypothetical protein
MVRYTKDGQLDGEANLQLPPITERLVEERRGWTLDHSVQPMAWMPACASQHCLKLTLPAICNSVCPHAFSLPPCLPAVRAG